MEQIIIVMVFGFLSGFVDAIAGGGGLISIPALLLINLPPALVLGTNKLASTMSSMTSSINYFRSGHVKFGFLKWAIPLIAAGSASGAILVSAIPAEFLKPVISVLLVLITLRTVLKKKQTEKAERTRTLSFPAKLGMAFLLAVIGFYDGFFGPGTGSFLIFSFYLMGHDFVTAAGNAKVVNFVTNVSALAAFLIFGLVNFQYGLLMGLSMIPGAYLGSRLAIKKGNAFVKPIFLMMTLTIVGKQVFDMLNH
ncbi:sulfite exporter TauE/SafE family protein [Ferviditalea candida]|uniref:Probable membrane transporter protein n=1 Tax=Ferviditalea candida TaxID=3108399 RepID=A0ABU5ZNT6_9BACL|nr:TSUP family transporter [Paenibacillaceae bacterium T2]